MGMPQPPSPLVFTYIDPDGTSWYLSDFSMVNGYCCAGIAGIEGFPVSLQTVPMLDGTAIPNFYIPQPGNIALALVIAPPASNDENAYYRLLDSINRAFYNRRNDIPKGGWIQVQRPDGTTRQIQTFTTAGLDTPEVGLNDVTVLSVTLQTPDPHWTDINSQSLIYTQGGATGILPLLPIWLSAGTIIGNAVITNGGTAQTWPTWTITGPGTPTLKNNTSGRQWSLNTAIPAGNVVQVTTKPGSQTAVNLTTQTNIWDQLVLGTSIRNLWPLMSGNNQVSITMAGATAATSVEIDWVNRWTRA